MTELTVREKRVAKLLGEGLSNAEIAAKLDTSEQYVKNRMRTIFEKMEVKDRIHLAVTLLAPLNNPLRQRHR